MTIPEMLSTSGPWVTPGHPERLLLEAWASTVGQIPFVTSGHNNLVVLLSDDERQRLGLLTGSLVIKNLRHDDLARVSFYTLRAHEYLDRDTPEERAAADVRAALFPDDLKIVHASFRESAGRAMARPALLTEERSAVLANIPVRGRNLLDVVNEWTQVGLELGEIEDQRATPTTPADSRLTRRAARSRWIRAVKGVLGALQFEAEERPEAARILERVESIQAAVRRRLRAANRAPGGDDEPGDGPDDGSDDIGEDIGTPDEQDDALPVTGSERR